MRGLCLNVAALDGGVAFNVMPDARPSSTWSLRPYPGFDRAAWDREVAALVAAVERPAITLEHVDRSRTVRVDDAVLTRW